MSYQASSIDSRAAESPRASGAGVLTRAKRRTLVNAPPGPGPQQSTSRHPEVVTDEAQGQAQVQGPNQVELPQLPELPVLPQFPVLPQLPELPQLSDMSEGDDDEDWEDDSESSSSLTGSTSASSSRRSRGRSDKKRRRKSRDSTARSYSSRGLVQGTGSVPRVVTRRLAKIMSIGLDKAEARSLRDQATPSFDSKSFTLKCPVVDESMQIAFKQIKNTAAEATEKYYLSFQYKILDIAKPLLALRGAFESESVTIETLRGLTDLALDMWALAFNYATHSRRRNILKVTEAELLLLLNNADHFSTNEISYLFGEKFVKAMRDQATHMTTLRNVKRVVNQPTRSNRGRGYANTQRFPRKEDQSTSSNRGQFQRYADVQVLSKAIPPVNCVGGILKYSAEQWHLVTNDSWVFQTVRDGLINNFHIYPFSTEFA